MRLTPPSEKQLLRARDEFRGLLEARTGEAIWQSFFKENPYVLSMSLPLRLEPEDIVPLGRPGLTEPDFTFYSKRTGVLPSWGVIELKRPDTKLFTRTRSNTYLLSREAATAVQQAQEYSQNDTLLPVEILRNTALMLGNRANLFVILGMAERDNSMLQMRVFRDIIDRQLPSNLQIIPYDRLLKAYETNVPLHVLVPVAGFRRGPITRQDRFDEDSFKNELVIAIRRLPAALRLIYVLHDIEGYTHPEIAAMLDTTTGTCKGQLRKARERLGTMAKAVEQRQSGAQSGARGFARD
jgi:hypothetical protein